VPGRGDLEAFVFFYFFSSNFSMQFWLLASEVGGVLDPLSI
jgi:hypothetical protein